MNKITESEIEKFAIEVLETQGYQYIYAPDIAPDLSACDMPAPSGARQAGGDSRGNRSRTYC